MSWRDPHTWSELNRPAEIIAIWCLLSYWRRAHDRVLDINICVNADRGFWFELG